MPDPISLSMSQPPSPATPKLVQTRLGNDEMAVKFDKLVRNYTYQLTAGCGDNTCDWKLCASCSSCLHVSPSVAAVTALQLAGRNKYYFCPRLRQKFLASLEDQQVAVELPLGVSEAILETGKSSHPSTSPKPVKKSAPFLFSMLGSSSISQIFKTSRSDLLNPPIDGLLQVPSLKASKSVGFTTPSDTPKPYIDFLREADVSRDASPVVTPALSKRSISSMSGLGIEWFEEPTKPTPFHELPETLNLQTCKAMTDAIQVNDVLEREYAVQRMYDSVQRVLGNGQLLNQSWLDTDKHPSGIDLDGLRSSYELLLHFPGCSLFERNHLAHIMMESIELLLSRFQPRSIHPTQANVQLRQLIILLECPLFVEPAHRDVLRRLLTAFSQLRSRTKQILIEWFARYDAESLQRLIDDVIQPFVTVHVGEGASVAKGSDAASQLAGIKMLQLFYLANEAKTPLLPLGVFYNAKVSGSINAKEEIKKFQQLLQDVSSGLDITTQEASISYLQYGFLLDPPSKLRLIRSSAMSRMLTEVEEAFVTTSVIMQAAKFFQNESISQLEDSLKDATNPFLMLRISRENLVESTLQQLTDKSKDLLKPLRVAFTSGEEGVDMGGVQKEFFAIITDALMDPEKGMFTYDEETRFSWINGFSLEDLVQFELVGQIIGLSLYNGVQIDVKFPKLFYKKLLGEKATLYDVQDAFPSLGHGLQQLLDWDPSMGDVEDLFCRMFEVSYDVYGEIKTFDLVPNGSQIAVTNDNRQEFVDKYIDHYTNKSISKQFAALKRGFNKVCGSLALQVCRAEELEQMICGSLDFNIDDLMSKARYDGYEATDTAIVDFWAVVHDMTLAQKKQLLEFTTGSDRVPLKGLGELAFVIQRDGKDDYRLPKAHTCFGTLLLPEYSSRAILQEKLLSAIENCRGFGLM